MSSLIEKLRRNLHLMKSQVDSGTEIPRTIKEVEDSCDNSLTILDELAAEFEDNTQFWETKCEVLFEILIEARDLVSTASEKIVPLGEANFRLKDVIQLQDKIKKLEVIINDLRQDMEERKIQNQKLVLGQVAFNIDKFVSKRVLDKLVAPDHFIGSIMEMELAIEGHRSYADVFQNEKERKIVEQEWESLQKKLNWSPKLFRYMQDLKKDRLDIAHPPVDKESILAAMENVPQKHKLLFLQLFTIHEEVRH